MWANLHPHPCGEFRHLVKVMAPIVIPVAPEYASYVDDLMRMAALHVIIHVMYVSEGREPLGSRHVLSLLAYTLLAISFYHLIARRVFTTERRDLKAKTSI